MNVKAAEVMLERLSAVDWVAWEPAFEHAESRARLLREYLRRAALWAEALGGAPSWPFFDIAGLVHPEGEIEPELTTKLEELIEEKVPGVTAPDACRSAVRWASLPEAEQLRFPQLPDPFEPLIRMFERGGGVSLENGMVDFVTTRVRIRDWQSNIASEPVVSMDDAALDALDS
ncbi:hypothetical protein GCM10020229_11720 [Kitasatospora albolonga]|uniref:hypothetical protein n=1 Tax=Kitasatospora albolonga TaxID=68173 RepID=UPI0031E6B1D3